MFGLDDKSRELKEVIADLQLIKEAVSKSDSIITFIDIRRVIRPVMLIGGLLIAFFSLLFYYLIENYGSFIAIPLSIRAILFILIGLACCLLGYLKLGNFLKSARGISGDMTLNRLFSEIYTPRLLVLMLPFLLVITLVIVFLCSKGHILYITPALAILFGLMYLSMGPLFYLKELYLLSMWLIATGILSLFFAANIHPLAVVGLTFSAGFILSSLLLYMDLPDQKS